MEESPSRVAGAKREADLNAVPGERATRRLVYACCAMRNERERRRLTATRGIPVVSGYEGSVLKVLQKEAHRFSPHSTLRKGRRTFFRDGKPLSW
jgi:hypothetical protein